jgi:hypothetical protein
MSKTTYRAFQGLLRMSTAVSLKDDTVLQVYPSKHEYSTLDAWKSAWPDCEYTVNQRTTTTDVDAEHAAAEAAPAPGPAAKKLRGSAGRREYEFAEFLHNDYKWLIRSVTRTDEETLDLVLNDGSACRVKRTLDFVRPPEITRNEMKYIQSYNYSPAITAVRWLMMLMFVTPDEDGAK